MLSNYWMKRIAFISFVLIASQAKTYTQYYFYNDKYYNNNFLVEVGPSLGGMNCFTDVGGNSIFQNMNVCGGFYARANFNNVLAIRLEYTMGEVDAADSLNKKKSVQLRNFSFRSSIDEVSLTAEFYPLSLIDFASGLPRFSPYIFGGIGYFAFNPQTYYKGFWINLQPLHTEGEGFAEYPNVHNYSLSQINIPAGIGLKYELSAIFTISGEIEYRFLETDYLDDVSKKFINPSLFSKYLSPIDAQLAQVLYSRRYEVQPRYMPNIGSARASNDYNDAYYSFNFKLGININRQRR